MLRTVKPRNARSKRALEAREPKEVEDECTAIFVHGSRTGEVVNKALRDLISLKQPHAIPFSKKNAIRPFEDTSSLEFWARKNDASMFVVGQSTKKRPAGLTIARTFDFKLLDMCELGIDKISAMSEFKTSKAALGHKPMLHFASELFDTHPRYIQLKSLLLNLFSGAAIDSIFLPGLQHVISVTAGPSTDLNTTSIPLSGTQQRDFKSLPKVHLRTYTVTLLPSGTPVPRVELMEMGPFIDFSLRRSQEADSEMWKAAMKKPKLKKQDIEKGLGKKRKNLEVDDVGDLRGRIHIAKQELGKLQSRKMKGLKEDFGTDSVENMEGEETVVGKKHRQN